MAAVIVGNGLTGIALSLAFTRHKIPFTYLETSAFFPFTNHILWVPASASLFFKKYGIWEEFLSKSVCLNEYQLLNGLGEKLQSVEHTQELIYAIRIQDLINLILKEVPQESVLKNQRIEFIKENIESVEVKTNSGIFSGDIVIGADGLHSVVRNKIFKSYTDFNYSGFSSWRGYSDFTIGSQYKNKFVEIWGQGTGFYFSEIPGGQVAWSLYRYTDQGGVDKFGDVRRKLMTYSEKLPNIAKQILAESQSSEITRIDLHLMEEFTSYVSRNIVLIGDAAHANFLSITLDIKETLKDITDLAELFSSDLDKGVSLQNFEKKRKAEIRESRSIFRKKQGKIATRGAIQSYFRDQVAKQKSQVQIEKDMEKIGEISF
jgi:2-polyprenyl-6-methoxyphenol hydroxylase-like FAD-dependent oxidoreductase